MEPVRYLRALRRRWWVIVAAVLVASVAAWVTTTIMPPARVVSPPKTYSATTVIRTTGATIGQDVNTSLNALVTAVTFNQVASIAAKRLDFPGRPLALTAEVEASADLDSGFVTITWTASFPERAVAVSTAFSKALIAYVSRLNAQGLDVRQDLLQRQIRTLLERGAKPIVIAPLRVELTQVILAREAQIPITTIQPAKAVPVTDQVSPGGLHAPRSRTSRVLLAALIGLLAGLILALILERFDPRIRSPLRAEQAFGLPVLAEVPAIPRRRRKTVVTASRPYSRAAGAFRLLGVGTARWTSNGEGRMAADRRSRPTAAKTILVTSPEAGDGKTTVAANLAVAYAQAGSRVLVVSCDLRRPAIHKAFGVRDRPGLADLLMSTDGGLDPDAPVDLTPYLEPCSVVRVAVLPSGTTPERPGELLASPKMPGFLERLKRVTDVIILDCAPLVVAGDVVPLLPLVDGVVLVARAGRTRDELAGSAAALLERLGASRVGVVLNDAREFSIPLAKRRAYRPTRKMRRAARLIPPQPDQEPWIRNGAVLEPEVHEPESIHVKESVQVKEPDVEVDEPPIEEPEAQQPTVEEPRIDVPEVGEPRESDVYVQVPDAAERNGLPRSRVPTPVGKLEPGHQAEDSRWEPRVQVTELPEELPRAETPEPQVEASLALKGLQKQLADLREELDGPQMELPDPRIPDLADPLEEQARSEGRP